MSKLKRCLMSSTMIPMILGGGAVGAISLVAMINTAPPAVAQCSPCAAKNPCAAANPCNPCAAKNPCAAANPCNPCAAANPCNPCNPCAAGGGASTNCVVPRLVAAHACNPCAAKNPCAANACNPCAAKACNPCAAKACNPCAAKACNPCAAKNPCAASACNPCAAKACNPCAANACNPCAAKNPCAANACNPCAAKNPCAAANPCGACNPCNPCGPCGAGAVAEITNAEAAALDNCLRGIMQAGYAKSGGPVSTSYGNWPKFNTVAYQSATHGSRYVNNYGNAVAKNYGKYENVGTMPKGSILAKDSFQVGADGKTSVGPLFVMEKMGAGFKAASKDWRYSMVMPNGTIFGVTGGKNDAAMNFCYECHIVAEETDTLMFMPEEFRK